MEAARGVALSVFFKPGLLYLFFLNQVCCTFEQYEMEQSSMQ